MGWLALSAVLAVALVACSSGTNKSHGASGGASDTVTFAEAPSAPPNYIFPLTGPDHFSTNNISQFSQIMYPPLYWFGTNGEPTLNKSLSVAYPPVLSDNNTVATIRVKHWKWSNGAPITARDVIFWLNLLSAVTDPSAPTVGSSSSPGPGWGAAVTGEFPENVVSYRQVSRYSLDITFNGSYNPTWLTYNQLSQIVPIPQASWDRTSQSSPVGNDDASAETRVALAGTSPTQYVPAHPGSATSGALGVAQFLNLQSEDVGTYVTNPLWQVVDGSFKLAQYTSSGYVKMVPNKNYSGEPKPKISAFEELPFTSDTAEFNALKSGTVTIGYIPAQDLGDKGQLERSEGYSFAPWYTFGVDYTSINFTNPKTGPLFDQLYLRQALESLINQKEYVKDFWGGLGEPDNGLVPQYPQNNPDESPLEAKGEVYPYSPKTAAHLLSSNGWTVVPGGQSYCSKPGDAPGDCGEGIAKGETISLRELYLSGVVPLANEMQAWVSALKQYAGIRLTLSTASFSGVISTAYNGCTAKTPCAGWDLVDWGAPLELVYSPNYYPTGDEQVATGAASNAGYYSDPNMDRLILATESEPSASTERAELFRYEDYAAKQLPLLWLPTGPSTLTMYKKTLHGLLPQGVYDELYPQDYSVSKG
ncbi:MAG: ABC transporter substrate-binding protein [Candidatus Dormibacteria bacterium]